MPISCYESWLSRSARMQAAVDEMRLKTKPKDCAVRAQKARENVLAKRAEQKEKKELQTLVVTTVQTTQRVESHTLQVIVLAKPTGGE